MFMGNGLTKNARGGWGLRGFAMPCLYVLCDDTRQRMLELCVTNRWSLQRLRRAVGVSKLPTP
jgi:hypothetical protein